MANLTSTTITGNLTVTGTATGLGFESGTKMVFYQASAPTGWTQDTASALSNTVMSVVTGTGGGTGGSTSYFSSFLATTDKSGTDSAPVSGSVSGTVGGHTLSTPEIASHSHGRQYIKNNPTQTQIPAPQFYVAAPGIKRAYSPFGEYEGNPFPEMVSQGNAFSAPTENAGGGGSHSHPFSGSLSSATADVSVTVPAANVKYANVIVAAKD